MLVRSDEYLSPDGGANKFTNMSISNIIFSPNSCLLELWAYSPIGYFSYENTTHISMVNREADVRCAVKVKIGQNQRGGNLLLLPLPFFQSNCCIWGEPARAIMSPPTDRISPCRCHQSLASLNQKWRCEKNGEILLRINFLLRFALTFFIIEVLWFAKPVTWDFSTPRQDIAPSLLPLPCVSLSKATLSKEW
jgi:hypothetical protein